jgi:hypothetical protein
MTASDTGVIYYSGVATADSSGDVRLAVEEEDSQAEHREKTAAELENRGLSGNQLKQSLAATRGRLVLMLDARSSSNERSLRKTIVNFCGASEEQSSDRIDASIADLLRDLLTEDYGVVVFSAGRDESAAEAVDAAEAVQAAAAVESRPFAEAIVEGLSGKADADRDGVIQTGELGRYVTRRSKELRSKATSPTVERPNGSRSFPIGGAAVAPEPTK